VASSTYWSGEGCYRVRVSLIMFDSPGAVNVQKSACRNLRALKSLGWRKHLKRCGMLRRQLDWDVNGYADFEVCPSHMNERENAEGLLSQPSEFRFGNAEHSSTTGEISRLHASSGQFQTLQMGSESKEVEI
jgi:hypothetical protein